jgi:RNA polymerase sigma-70 factor (ECF subfamily)
MESVSESPSEREARSATVFELSRGRVETFELFYRREMPALVAFAAALSGSACAEDIAQEAMLAAYRRWAVVSGLEVPAAWVRRVCANRCVSTLRRRAVEARALLRLGTRRGDHPVVTEEHDRVWAEVRRLPHRQAQVIALYAIYDLGVPEIAATLGCAEGTVKAHLARGRAALARRFDQSVVEES